MPDMARTHKIPMGGSATCSSKVWLPSVMVPPIGTTAKMRDGRDDRQVGRQLEDEGVGPVGQQVFLEDQLGAVGQCLQQAPRTGPVGADAALHVRDHLALEPDHEARWPPSSATKATTTFMRTMRMTSQLRPLAKRGSPAPWSGCGLCAAVLVTSACQVGEEADHTDSSRTSVTRCRLSITVETALAGRVVAAGHVEVDGDNASGHARSETAGRAKSPRAERTLTWSPCGHPAIEVVGVRPGHQGGHERVSDGDPVTELPAS